MKKTKIEIITLNIIKQLRNIICKIKIKQRINEYSVLIYFNNLFICKYYNDLNSTVYMVNL